jgi:hypothetical protein
MTHSERVSQRISDRHMGQPVQTALLYRRVKISIWPCQTKLTTTATNTISPSSCVGWLWPWLDEAQWPYWPAGCGPAHWACSARLGPLACPPVVTLTDPCQNECTWPHGRYGSVISQFPLLIDSPSFYNAFQLHRLCCQHQPEGPEWNYGTIRVAWYWADIWAQISQIQCGRLFLISHTYTTFFLSNFKTSAQNNSRQSITSPSCI